MLADGGDALCRPAARCATRQALFGPVASDCDGVPGDRADRRRSRTRWSGSRRRARRPGARAWRRGGAPAADRDRSRRDADRSRTPTRRARRATTRAASAFTRCWPTSTRPRRRSAACCGPATPAPTPPPTDRRARRRAGAVAHARRSARDDPRARADSAGATHELIDFCRDGRLRFSVGFDLTEPVRAAILALARGRLGAGARPRTASRATNGARVAEITDRPGPVRLAGRARA